MPVRNQLMTLFENVCAKCVQMVCVGFTVFSAYFIRAYEHWPKIGPVLGHRSVVPCWIVQNHGGTAAHFLGALPNRYTAASGRSELIYDHGMQ